VHFALDGDAVVVRIEHMSELGEDLTFEPSVGLTPGPYKGSHIAASIA
jgi:hypothetical protein